MASLPLKASRNVQHFVICFLWAKGLRENAPSDYHLIGLMKKMLGGQKFASDTELQSTDRQWLLQQPAASIVF